MPRFRFAAVLTAFLVGMLAASAQAQNTSQERRVVGDTGGGNNNQDTFVVYDGSQGPNSNGKHIVLVSGDEEYRSEETLPALGKILARRHGFKCTVLFAIDPGTGEINPNINNNIPGLQALQSADLLVLFTRFRDLPDDQMRYIAEYVEAGKPIVAIRTATHAFKMDSSETYKRYSVSGGQWQGGFGKHVLGETWVNHHGAHGRQSSRGIIAPGNEDHPILRGINDGDIWGPTDVYGVRLPLRESCQPLVMGQVLDGMQPDSVPLEGGKNDPMMPIAWTNAYESPSGEKARVFTSTIGASQDFASEGVRRLLVNACYWAMGLEDEMPEMTDVELVGEFDPTPFGFDGYQRGVKPKDLQLGEG